MKVFKVLIFLLLIVGFSLAAQQIVSKFQLTSPKQVLTKPEARIVFTIPRDETGHYALGDIFLLNNGESWAAGYDGQHTDTLFHSKDIGKTWQPSLKVSGTGYNTKAVMFADAEIGWAVGVGGLAVRTTNGGISWESLNISTKAELNAVHFFNSNIGYVAGGERFGNKTDEEVTGSVEIHCTEDGGATWRRCYKEDEFGTVFQIATLSETEAFAILDGTRLMRTDNQGKAWQHVPISAMHVSSIAFASDEVGWIVGAKGLFQSSSDRGRTWDKPNNLNQGLAKQDWNAVAFNSSGVGLAVGKDGALALTIDNGKTWELLALIKSDDLSAVRIQGADAMILGRQKLYSLDLSESPIPSLSAK